MKKLGLLVFLFIAFAPIIKGQEAFKNFGTIKMHDDSSVGFHTNLINNGDFDENLGFTGFYGDAQLTVSGSKRAVFNDVEVDIENGLLLYSSLGVKNDFYFTNGIVITPRTNNNISLDYIDHMDYYDEGDEEHVDGYLSYIGDSEFVFPIGDDDSLRPMELPSQDNLYYFKGAYFRENPNNIDNTFATVFNTFEHELLIGEVNHREFWDLDGDHETEVTLTWDQNSSLSGLADSIDNLIVVGWDPIDNKWRNLGRTYVSGDISNGKISSAAFTPDNFTVLTIGSELTNADFTIHNAISPNSDDFNEFFVIEGIEHIPNNTLEIFNRYGNLVYFKEGYNNTWNGRASVNTIYPEDERLPQGTYFYILKLKDQSIDYSGWIYVAY